MNIMSLKTGSDGRVKDRLSQLEADFFRFIMCVQYIQAVLKSVFEQADVPFISLISLKH